MRGQGANPAIVVLGYNRPDSLQRLLRSLKLAEFPTGSSIPLVISLDHSPDRSCTDLAQSFDWAFGEKIVLTRESRLGLREHVLACGDLSQNYGSIIMLEDDLLVSRAFYSFAVAAIKNYGSNPQIAGISLYSHQHNFQARLPFQPVPNGDDTFFLRFPSSWGQAWSASQWHDFRVWLGSAPYRRITADVPPTVVAWPETSWLKHASAYAVETDKTWVYPYQSFSTNFGEPGTNSRQTSTIFQVPLVQSGSKEWRFSTFGETLAEYDQYFENSSQALARVIEGFDWEMDAYGTKPPHAARSPFLVTSRKGSPALAGYNLRFKPWELNILNGNGGTDLQLISTASLSMGTWPRFSERQATFASPMRATSRALIRWLLDRLKGWLKSRGFLNRT